ncbi:MAG TPA: TetR family transcriptional regulator [Bryobacteraceae bacterium]|nr:TetR family transcriptional regulator [Bryobacteraceae bacterium]
MTAELVKLMLLRVHHIIFTDIKTRTYFTCTLYSDTFVNMSEQRLTRRERQLQTRLKLIESAERVFARIGFDAASIEEVAADAGFSAEHLLQLREQGRVASGVARQEASRHQSGVRGRLSETQGGQPTLRRRP